MSAIESSPFMRDKLNRAARYLEWSWVLVLSPDLIGRVSATRTGRR
jgi:hypothetical protein